MSFLKFYTKTFKNNYKELIIKRNQYTENHYKKCASRCSSETVALILQTVEFGPGYTNSTLSGEILYNFAGDMGNFFIGFNGFIYR